MRRTMMPLNDSKFKGESVITISRIVYQVLADNFRSAPLFQLPYRAGPVGFSVEMEPGCFDNVAYQWHSAPYFRSQRADPWNWMSTATTRLWSLASLGLWLDTAFLRGILYLSIVVGSVSWISQ